MSPYLTQEEWKQVKRAIEDLFPGSNPEEDPEVEEFRQRLYEIRRHHR